MQAEGADNLTKNEANGKPIKVKPEVPPKPKRKANLVVTENQEIVPPPEIKNEATITSKQEVKPEVMPQIKPEVIMKIRPEVKSLSKPEVKEGPFRKSEPGQKPLDYSRVIPPANREFFPVANPEVKSQTKPNVIPPTKSRVILHTKTRVVKQTSHVVIQMQGNRVEGEAKPIPKIMLRLQATLQVRRVTATITMTENKPKPATEPEIIRQTGGAGILTPEPRVVPNQDMDIKLHPISNFIPFCETKVKMQSQDLAISKAENESRAAAIPEVIRQTAKANIPKPEAEPNQEMNFYPQAIPSKPEVIMQSKEVIFKTGNESEQRAEPIQWKAENKIKSEGKLNQEVIFKPQAIPDALSPRKPKVITQSKEVISKLENIFQQKAEPSQETDILRAENNTKLEAKLNEEVSFTPLRKPEVIMQSKGVNPKSEKTFKLKAEPSQKIDILKAENKTKLEAKFTKFNKPEDIIQSRGVLISKKDKFKLNAEPSQETDILRAENNTKFEAKLNEEVSFTPLRKPEVIMQSKGVNPKSEKTFKLKAEPSQEIDILKADNKVKLEAKLNEEVFFKPRLVPDVFSLTKPEDIMQSRGVVISKKDKCKLNAEPSHETDILMTENKFNLEAKWNKELFFKPRFIPDVLSLTKPEVIMQSHDAVFSKPENKFKLNTEPSLNTDIRRAEKNINLKAKLNEEVFFKRRFIPDNFSLTKPEVIKKSNEDVFSKKKNKFKLRAEPCQKIDILMPENKTTSEAELNQEVIFTTRLIPHLLSLNKPEVITQAKEVFIPKSKNPFKLLAESSRRTDFVRADNKIKLEAKLNEDMIFKPRLIPEVLSLRKPKVIMQSKDVISKPQNKCKRKTEPSQETDFLKPENKIKSEAVLNQEVILKQLAIPNILPHSKPEDITQSQEVAISNTVNKPNQEAQRDRDVSEIWDIFNATGIINPEDEAKMRSHLDSYDYSDVGNIDMSPEESDEFLKCYKARAYLRQRDTDRTLRELEGMRRNMKAINEKYCKVEEELDKWFSDKARWAREFRL